MPAPQTILDLVARFSEHIDAYKTGTYNETQLRRDFLDPFFKELGWDVDNTAGYAEAYRDVIHEDQVKVEGAVKAPDYDRYNSGLFHFRAEKERHEEHDTLTPHLVIDDSLLKPLIRGLYYPDSPYEFSVLSADILGQVYEQFLGKIIRLTEGHQARIEDKPEVKKAGGVFYTPTYIVDYIVRQTVGPLIEDKTPKQIEHLRVLDPACGSGSFLIGAYQFLLDWHHLYYSTHEPEKWLKGKNPALVVASGGGWKLTTTERKRILLAHIHGVDIDKPEWVEEVVLRPTLVEPDPMDAALEHRLAAIPELAGRVLRVIVSATEPKRVVTAYPDRKMKGRL